ncbi:MAG: hypothetical protein EBR30_24040 [Cytophagia bacterium]|jgi:hypothetical protein|nr:hypothetical protein [Cytophagia bacterium]
MKYNVGDLIVETCFKHIEDYRVNLVISASEQCVTLLHHASDSKDVYDVKEIDHWIKRDNAKHYPVNK